MGREFRRVLFRYSPHARHFLKKAKLCKTVKKQSNMARIKFQLPQSITHKTDCAFITKLVKRLNDEDKLDYTDLPQLHRMATAYDAYLPCVDVLSEKGMTMCNLKGERVKRPEANLLKENWSQYLELAKEYGLTAKSKQQLRATSTNEEASPLDTFMQQNQ